MKNVSKNTSDLSSPSVNSISTPNVTNFTKNSDNLQIPQPLPDSRTLPLCNNTVLDDDRDKIEYLLYYGCDDDEDCSVKSLSPFIEKSYPKHITHLSSYDNNNNIIEDNDEFNKDDFNNESKFKRRSDLILTPTVLNANYCFSDSSQKILKNSAFCNFCQNNTFFDDFNVFYSSEDKNDSLANTIHNSDLFHINLLDENICENNDGNNNNNNNDNVSSSNVKVFKNNSMNSCVGNYIYCNSNSFSSIVPHKDKEYLELESLKNHHNKENENNVSNFHNNKSHLSTSWSCQYGSWLQLPSITHLSPSTIISPSSPQLHTNSPSIFSMCSNESYPTPSSPICSPKYESSKISFEHFHSLLRSKSLSTNMLYTDQPNANSNLLDNLAFLIFFNQIINILFK
jgi:hypothetical protein